MVQPEALKSDEPLFWSAGRGTDVWAMLTATAAGDLDTVSGLVAKDASLVRGAHEYRPALYFAVRENRLDVAAFLLHHGASPFGSGTPDTLLEIARDRGYEDMAGLLEDALARRGASSRGNGFAAAIRSRDLDRIRDLLSASPELVHATDERTNRPIHWAAMTRQLEIIDELLARGADIDAKRADGARPIQLANGDYGYRGWRDVPPEITVTPRQVIDHLRARGAYCDICTAAWIGDINRVRGLLDEDPTLANRPAEYVTYYACSGTPLRNAAAGGHIEIVRLLLDRGADPNLPEEHIAPRGHALYSAVYNGHHDIAKLLLEKGAHANVPVESSADTLSIALMRSDSRMVELLCSYGAARSVHLLAHGGDVETAAAVFNANPDLANDPAALENAAQQGHIAFVRLMLRYRPDLARRVGAGGRTREITELLFVHGMSPNFADWLNIAPLHRFAQAGDIANAEMFIEHGADLHARDDELSSTPLGWAAKFGRTQMAELLLDRGAQPELPDDPPWATPLAWARRRGHDEIADLLIRRGASH